MSVAKIALLIGASVVTAGSSAAVATRDKWWPETTTSNQELSGNPSGDSDVSRSEGEARGANSRSGEGQTTGVEPSKQVASGAEPAAAAPKAA